MTNERQTIGRLHGQAIALYDLLSVLEKDHFSRTREVYCGHEQDWMNERYNSIAAGLNAAIAITDTIKTTVESLWDSADRSLHND